MINNDFEKAFSDFLDSRDYDKASDALFLLVRMAFLAGWEAAGGDMPQSARIFELL